MRSRKRISSRGRVVLTTGQSTLITEGVVGKALARRTWWQNSSWQLWPSMQTRHLGSKPGQLAHPQKVDAVAQIRTEPVGTVPGVPTQGF